MTAFALDPEIAGFVARSEACYPATANAASVADNRAAYDRMCRAFAAPHPLGLVATDGLLRATRPQRDIVWRRYVPAGAIARSSMLYLHGGGYVVGGLASHDSICADLAAAASVVLVALDYRLAPEHVYPAALDDAEAAFDTLSATCARVVVAGDSAGGGLAAALCLRLRRQGKALPAGQVLIYPGLHPHAGHAMGTWREAVPMLTTSDSLAYRRLYTGRADADVTDDPELAPLAARDLAGLPPAAIFAADIDPLAEDSALYAAALRQAGVAVSLHAGDGLVHGFLRGRHASARVAAVFAEIAARLRALAADQEPGGTSSSS